MLSEKDEELNRLIAEKDNLERKLKSAKKNVNSTPAENDTAPAGTTIPTASMTQKQLEKKVSQLRRSIKSQVLNQMVYKRSITGESRLVPIEINDVAESAIASLVGEQIYSEASSGPKQLKLVLSNEECDVIVERSFSKTLRFGATLALTKGLQFVYSKADCTLKITGAYKMYK